VTNHDDRQRTLAELEAYLDVLRAAPLESGTLDLVVRRPGVGLREVLDEAELSLSEGLVGDGWKARGSRNTPDRAADPFKQLNVMSSRMVSFLAVDADRRALAGDQLYVDLDISHDNLPTGSQLRIGEAVIEVTPAPHNGCDKFMARFGEDTTRFVNSRTGRRMRLRGLNAKVVEAGTVRQGDKVVKL
jgi:MOSC domain-containing protein YiiM